MTRLDFLSFLITYNFWSRLGFLISYTAAFLLVLEVVRLAYTDANKREVEKLLDAYTQSRSEYATGRRQDKTQASKVSIEDLEKAPPQPHTPERRTRTRSPAVTPAESERTLVSDAAAARKRRAQSSASVAQTQVPSPPPPTRRLRKRSDTLNSASSSSESKKLERRRREASPASSAGSKASSRHASPTATRKVREKEREAQQLSSSLHKLLRQRG